ncbi:hypothetical protein BKA82DRAFT_441453 [Pisolithus tinctorius]|uniref:Uncharacterized protein n=1 Tax=Pisolithus tinctorius Marx 270 TaxID=870435 RepID=A0A0C3P159_PISTI|nr:hypothetical protein BKA82DRAFT_441453 [Pisolithus tinctorius]KIO06815.1 hypothetical protein M404DRAFT_441453 [Pisolithus tinctorius Marx 270]
MDMCARPSRAPCPPSTFNPVSHSAGLACGVSLNCFSAADNGMLSRANGWNDGKHPWAFIIHNRRRPATPENPSALARQLRPEPSHYKPGLQLRSTMRISSSGHHSFRELHMRDRNVEEMAGKVFHTHDAGGLL